jgi:hypothetical protein
MINEQEIQNKLEEVQLYFNRYSWTKDIELLEEAYKRSTELRQLIGTSIKEIKNKPLTSD